MPAAHTQQTLTQVPPPPNPTGFSSVNLLYKVVLLAQEVQTRIEEYRNGVCSANRLLKSISHLYGTRNEAR